VLNSSKCHARLLKCSMVLVADLKVAMASLYEVRIPWLFVDVESFGDAK
jgi:hypothetical protein